MKAIIYSFILFVFIFFTGAFALQAQDPVVIQHWDFEESLDNWVAGNEDSAIELSEEQALSGEQSVKLVKPATGLEINLQNDVYKDIQEGDILSVSVWISEDDLAEVNGFQIFWQTGEGWSWNNIWINGEDLTGDDWTTIEETLPAVATPLQRIGFQLLLQGGHEASQTTLYVDDIIISRIEEEPVEFPILIDQWGFIGGRVAGWQISVGDPGNVTISGDEPLTSGWSAIRGEFPPVTPAEGEAIIVSGQIDYVGQGPHIWNAMRYGMFRHDSTGTLQYAGTDTARWSGPENHAYGYLLMTMSGTNERAGWAVGPGADIGAVYGGSWISTFGGGTTSLAVVDQRLFRAMAPEGLYDYAISVHTQEDGNNQVRFYLIHEGGEYWYGGVVIDTTGVPTETYNGVAFAINADADTMTAVHFMDITVNVGEPLVLPDPPLETPPHGVGRILNENRRFELSSPGVTTDESFWSFNYDQSGANAEFEIVTDEAQDGDRSLRIDFGEWNSAADVWHVEAVNEPFYPELGDIIRANVWLKADEDGRMVRIYLGMPEGNWQRVPDWGMEVICTLTTEWQQFAFPDYTVIARDVNHAPDGAMRFGIEMNLEVNDGGVIWIDNAIVRKVGTIVSVDERPDIPLVFALEQNYPNPFNPTTQIQFTLPEQADVMLEVFDILGRRVATLINNEHYSMGNHSVVWNGTNNAGQTVSSGIYIYRIKAGSHVDLKRMVFIK